VGHAAAEPLGKTLLHDTLDLDGEAPHVLLVTSWPNSLLQATISLSTRYWKGTMPSSTMPSSGAAWRRRWSAHTVALHHAPRRVVTSLVPMRRAIRLG